MLTLSATEATGIASHKETTPASKSDVNPVSGLDHGTFTVFVPCSSHFVLGILAGIKFVLEEREMSTGSFFCVVYKASVHCKSGKETYFL